VRSCYQEDILSAPLQPPHPPCSDPVIAAWIAQMQQQIEAQEKELNYSRLKIQMLEEQLRQNS
jgi:hypothetical protein